MALLHRTGFELNSLTTGVEFTTVATTGASITTGSARSGTYGLRISSLSSATAAGALSKWAASTTNGPYYFGTYFNVQTLPSAENRIIVLDGASGSVGSTARAYITIDQTGVLRLYTGSGPTQIGSASSALSTNTWYNIEMYFDNTGGAGADTLTARINGTNFATSTTTTMPGGVFAYSVGGNLNSEAQTTGEWWFDDTGINDTSGSAQTSWLGEHKIIHVHPSGDGDNHMWLDNSLAAGTSSNYTLVSEAGTPDETTTYVQSRTTNDIDDYLLGSAGLSGGDTVNAILVGQRATRSAGTNSSSAVLRIKATSGGTVDEGTANSATNGSFRTNDLNTTQAAPYQLIVYQKPSAGGAYTSSDLDGAHTQIGIRTSTGSGDRYYQLTDIWALVDYTPSGSTSASITQVAATLTATGGTQTVATVNNVAITQVAANATATGGTQAIAAVNKVAVTQVSANITAAGGTQVIATVNNVSISQIAASITATGGTQSVVSVSFATISQVAANITATGGTQNISAGSVVSATVSQVAANITATGGTQVVASSQFAAISQVAANITATGGTQVLATVQIVSLAQVAATLTATGGTQTLAAVQLASISQVAANLTASGGVQSVFAGAASSVSISQLAASITATTGSMIVAASTGPPLKFPAIWTNNDVKVPGVWASTTKLPAVWRDNDIKVAAPWVQATKNADTWNFGPADGIPYLYDSALMTYDSAVVGYDYSNPQTNQLNALEPTAWSAH